MLKCATSNCESINVKKYEILPLFNVILCDKCYKEVINNLFPPDNTQPIEKKKRGRPKKEK